jgi:glycosyltransferase involved in cell wall biosynthesis
MRHQLALVARSDCVFAQTQREADFLASRGVSASKIVLLGMGVTPSEITGGNAAWFRERYQIRGPIVLFVGAVAYDKGAVDLVEAMKHLWATGVDATLVLAGLVRDQFAAYLAQQPAEVRERCLLPGVVIGGDKRDMFAAADVFAMPSRSDAFGIVYLEAWVCGLPVIGADAGGVPDVISDGTDGFLVPFRDTVALARRIKEMLENPQLARQMGERGKQKVLAHFTWDRVYRDVISNYERLAAQKVC